MASNQEHQQLYLLARYFILRLALHARVSNELIGSRGIHDDDILDFIGLGSAREQIDTADSRAQSHLLLRSAMKKLLKQHDRKLLTSNLLMRNIAKLGTALKLNEADQLLVLLAVLYQRFEPFEECLKMAFKKSRDDLTGILATISDIPRALIQKSMRRNSKLYRCNLVRIEFKSSHLEIQMPDQFVEQLPQIDCDIDAILSSIFTTTHDSQFTLADFEHITEVTDLKHYLQHAIQGQKPGANLLFYGAPGVGKTELTKALSTVLSCQLYHVPVIDEDGDPLPPHRRVNALNLCQALTGSLDKVIILFDEAEDCFPSRWENLFFSRSSDRIGKAWMNQLLEQNATPTIWLSNDISGIDKAFIRRFDFVIELKAPPLQKRKQLIAETLTDIAIDEKWLQHMAKTDHLTADMISRAKNIADLCCNEKEQKPDFIKNYIVQRLKSMGHKPSQQHRKVDQLFDYSITHLGIAAPQLELLQNVNQATAASLLFYGPPGTGKTALAHHLAEQCDSHLLKKRASDLLDCWVGETEKKIAQLFEQARDENAIILLDEADSFLRDREQAQRSWEVTQVNELLVQMEEFEGVFICATNLFDGLDQASLRRFDVKIGFNYLDNAAKRYFFDQLCQQFQLPIDTPDYQQVITQLARIEYLTPGDFAIIARQAQRLHIYPELERIVRQLQQESRLKNEPQQSMGFL